MGAKKWQQEVRDLFAVISRERDDAYAERDNLAAEIEHMDQTNDELRAAVNTLTQSLDAANDERLAAVKEAETRKVTQVRQALRIGQHEKELAKLCNENEILGTKLRKAEAEVNRLAGKLHRNRIDDDWPGTLRQIADHLEATDG